MTEITIIRGDKNFILDFTIYDADNNIVDLGGVTSILLKFKSYEDGIVRSISGTVIDAPNGRVQFPVGEEFVNILGEYKAEIEITYITGQVLTAPNISIKVIPDLE